MTRAEIRARINTLIGRSKARPYAFTTEEINRHINDAYSRISIAANLRQVRFGITAVNGQSAYDIPLWIARPFRVAFDEYALDYTTTLRLDHQDETWRTRTGQPGWWTRDRQDQNRIRIWPAPEADGDGGEFSDEYGTVVDLNDTDTYVFTAESGAVVDVQADDVAFTFEGEYGIVTDMEWAESDIEVWGQAIPLPLETDSQEPLMPGWAQQALVYWATASLLRSSTEHRNEALAAAYEQLAQPYLSMVENIHIKGPMDHVEVVGRGASLSHRRLRRETTIPVT